MSESLQKAPGKELSPKEKYASYVETMTTRVIAALPISVPDDQLKRARSQMRVAFSADAQGDLLKCSGESIARAIVLSAISGLFPGGPKPDVYLIPRQISGTWEVSWQISFRGYVRVARRAGWDLEPVLVYEGEEFKVSEGNLPSIHHVRNLDIEPTPELLRYGYIRVFREGQRHQAKIGYLTKKQMDQRRAKAQTQAVWNLWPLEMYLKTLCNYAGNREMFPLDDPARYAMEASEQTEIGGASPLALGAARPAALPEAREGATIDVPGAQSFEPAAGDGGVAPEDDRGSAGRTEPSPGILDRGALVDEIRSLTSKREDKADLFQRHFAAGGWLAVTKLAPGDLANGLDSLKRELDGVAELKREREPGEDE
jgi:recombinational DNA repair protein RecT